MVYDATRSELNSVVTRIFITDYDVDDIFLNFMLEPKLCPFAAVDITCLFPKEVSAENAFIRGCWERMLIGFSPSPYWVTKDLMEVEMMIRGNRRASGNVFGWKQVVFNLLGNFKYDPSIPWVYKMEIDVKIVSDLFFYVDDERPTAGSTEASWRETHRIYQLLCFLGIQDAYR